MELLRHEIGGGRRRGAPKAAGGAGAGEREASYSALTRRANRRTAAGVFLELLQLKTWDYVDVEQDAPFGEITIRRGPRFDDPIGAVGAAPSDDAPR